MIEHRVTNCNPEAEQAEGVIIADEPGLTPRQARHPLTTCRQERSAFKAFLIA